MASSQSLVSVSPTRAAEAFDRWKQLHGQRESDTARTFSRQIASRVSDLSADQLGLPTSRKTWSDWRLGKIRTKKYLSIKVCAAIHEMTGCDPTEDYLFKGQTRNTTQAIHLRSLLLRRLSNSPSEGIEQYEVLASSILFRLSETIEVDTEMTGGRGSVKFVLGRAKIGLREARISLKTEGQIVQSLTSLSSGSSPENGTVDGVFLQELPDQGTHWVIQPINAGYLIGEIANARLAKIECEQGTRITLTIGASEADMDVIFHPDFQNELEPLQQSHARKRIIAKMVHDRLKGSKVYFDLSVGEAIS